MSAWSDLPATVGDRLGLPRHASSKIAYGAKDGLLVQLEIAKVGDAECVQATIRYLDAGLNAAVRAAIDGAPGLAESGVKPRAVEVKDGLAVFRHMKPMMRTPAPEDVAAEVEALVKAVKSAVPSPVAGCRLCKGSGAQEPILLNGVVDRVCPSCIERLRHEAKRAEEAYENKPMNLPFALLAAAVLAAIGAIVWAGLAVATGSMYWAVGIGIGALVGFGTLKAAGKGGLPVQLIGAVFSVASVLLGQLLFVAYHVQKDVREAGEEFDWAAFFADSIEILKAGGSDTVFALVAGLIGALIAIQAASRPKHEVKVET